MDAQRQTARAGRKRKRLIKFIDANEKPEGMSCLKSLLHPLPPEIAEAL